MRKVNRFVPCLVASLLAVVGTSRAQAEDVFRLGGSDDAAISTLDFDGQVKTVEVCRRTYWGGYCGYGYGPEVSYGINPCWYPSYAYSAPVYVAPAYYAPAYYGPSVSIGVGIGYAGGGTGYGYGYGGRVGVGYIGGYGGARVGVGYAGGYGGARVGAGYVGGYRGRVGGGYVGGVRRVSGDDATDSTLLNQRPAIAAQSRSEPNYRTQVPAQSPRKPAAVDAPNTNESSSYLANGQSKSSSKFTYRAYGDKAKPKATETETSSTTKLVDLKQ